MEILRYRWRHRVGERVSHAVSLILRSSGADPSAPIFALMRTRENVPRSRDDVFEDWAFS